MAFAESHMILGVSACGRPRNNARAARCGVEGTRGIEPRLAGAYSTLGQLRLEYDRDWDGAASDFARAIALDLRTLRPICVGACCSHAGDSIAP